MLCAHHGCAKHKDAYEIKSSLILQPSPAALTDGESSSSGKGDNSLLGLAENALDYVDGDTIDRGDLGSRHAVLHPGANAAKLRARDLASSAARS
jgi:hypothetical protein